MCCSILLSTGWVLDYLDGTHFRYIKLKKKYSNDVESDSIGNKEFWIKIIYLGI